MNQPKKKQITLLQSWASIGKKNSMKNDSSIVDLCFSDDENLLQALEESTHENFVSKNDPPAITDLINSLSETSCTKNKRKGPDEPDFNLGWGSDFSDESDNDENEKKLMLEFCDHVEESFINVPTGNKNFINNDQQSRVGLNFSILPNENGMHQSNGTISLPVIYQPKNTISKCIGFDNDAGKSWIYPNNRPIRDYQFNIVQKAVFANTLVCLPTGLGKTFIAAVVMFNYYRWYPTGKVVFMAPTKPLVAQQIQACHEVMGLPNEDTAEMTGTMPPEQRKKSWMDKRAFYLTPQVMMNDLQRGACPALDVKCLVIDEAHKALGNHAYCQVVKELCRSGTEFRVVALSATPGSDIKAVQQVLTNLMISHIELRTEECMDVQQFTHRRQVEKVVVPLTPELNDVIDQYLRVIDRVLQRLRQLGVIYNKYTKNLSKFMVLKAREAFRKDPPPKLNNVQRGLIEGDFAMSISLYHGLELLNRHGLRSLLSFLQSAMGQNNLNNRHNNINNNESFGSSHGNANNSRMRTELMKLPEFVQMFDFLENNYDPISYADPNLLPQRLPSQTMNQMSYGHPKMKRLVEVVVDHFENFHSEDSSETRVMIFSSYRDSVNEITQLLNMHRPKIKAMSFIGHSSSGGGAKGFNQKEQLMVMERFREGSYNTLVSTCIGEEGLDIGEVDLIVCFDAHKSPIRLVQRMGRTGRKRQGHVIILVTQGKEEQIYKESQHNKNSIIRLIQSGCNSRFKLCLDNPRMIPLGCNPTCLEVYMEIPKVHKRGRLSSGVGSKGKSRKSVKGAVQMVTKEVTDSWKREGLNENGSSKFILPEEGVLQCLKSDYQNILRTSLIGPQGHTLSFNKCLSLRTGQSLESKNLNEVMEIVSLLRTSYTSGHYEDEMRLFLNMDDVITDNDRHHNLPTSDVLQTSAKRKTSRKISIEKTNTSRKKNAQISVNKSKKNLSMGKVLGDDDDETKIGDDNDGMFFLLSQTFSHQTKTKRNKVPGAKNRNDNNNIKSRTDPTKYNIREKLMEDQGAVEDKINKTVDDDDDCLITDHSSAMAGCDGQITDKDIDENVGDDNDNGNDGDDNDGDEEFVVPLPPDFDEIPKLLADFEKDFNNNSIRPVDVLELLKSWKGMVDDGDDEDEKKHDGSDLVDGDIMEAENHFPVDEDDELVGMHVDDITYHSNDSMNIKGDWFEIGIQNQFPGKTEANEPKKNQNLISSFLDTSVLDITESDFKIWSQSCKEVDAKAPASTPAKVSCNSFFNITRTPSTTAKDANKSTEDIVLVENSIDRCDKIDDSDLVPPSPTRDIPKFVNLKTAGNDVKNIVKSFKDPDIVLPSPSSKKLRGTQSSRVNFSSQFLTQGFKFKFETKHVDDDDIWNDDDDIDYETILLDDEIRSTKNGCNFKNPCITYADKSQTNAMKATQNHLHPNSNGLLLSQMFPDEPDFRTFIEDFENDFFPDEEGKKDETVEKKEGAVNKIAGDEVPQNVINSSPNISQAFIRQSKECRTKLSNALADKSQVTYTQALECLDYSNIFADLSVTSSMKGTNVKSSVASIRSSNSNHFHNDDDKLPLPTPSGIKSSSGVKCSFTEDILPNFDIGFDLDEWSDDDATSQKAIPCNANSTTGQSTQNNDKHDENTRLSNPASSRLSTTSNTNQVKTFECSTPTKTNSQKEILPLRERLMRNMNPQQEEGQIFTDLRAPCNQPISDQSTFDPKLNTRVEIPGKCNGGESGFDNDDFLDDQVFRSIMVQECIIENNTVKKQKVGNFKTPCCTSTPNVNFRKRQKMGISTPIDSPILAGHKKGGRNVIVSDAEDSPIVPQVKKLVPKKHGSLGYDDDLDDFEVQPNKTMLRKHKSSKRLFQDENSEIPEAKKKAKPNMMVKDFLEEEAEVSGDEDVSSDEDGGADDDFYERSFIDNHSQYQDSVDQQAFYRMVDGRMSTQVNHGRYKLKYPSARDRCIDVFSQSNPSCDEDEYEEDSFCVGESFVEHEVSQGLYSEELECTEFTQKERVKEERVKTKRKKAQKRKKTNNGNDDDHVINGVKKKKRRVLVHEDTDSNFENIDENPPHIKNISTQSTSTHHRHHHHPTHHGVPLSTTPTKTLDRSSSSSSPTFNSPSLVSRKKTAAVTNKNDLDDGGKNLKDQMDDRKMIGQHAPIIGHHQSVKISSETTQSTNYNNNDNQNNPDNRNNFNNNDIATTTTSSSSSLPRIRSNPSEQVPMKPVLIFNSQQVSSAQNLLSALRFNHGCEVLIRSFSECSCIISSRTAVDRIYLSDFTSFANKKRILEKLDFLLERYERVYLIIERDSGKNADPVNSVMKSKHSTNLLATLTMTSAQVLHSDSQDDTSSIINDLQITEKTKGFQIPFNSSSLRSIDDTLHFYLTLPNLSYLSACCLALRFRSVRDFINSTPNLVAEAGHLTIEKSKEIIEYFRHQFNNQMVSLVHKR